MTDDEMFRWILLAGLVVVLPIAFYHRFKSHTGETLDRSQEGPVILITRIVLGLGGMLLLIAYLIDPSWLSWSSVPLPIWLRWVGVGLGVLTAALLIWTFRTLGPNLTDTVVTRRVHTLVTTGPYRWIRHPFYVSFLLGMIANALLTANTIFFTSGVIAFTVLAIRTQSE